MASCLQGLAIALTAQERLLTAARLWGAAEAMHQNSVTTLPRVLRTSTERARATVRKRLGDKIFAQTLAEGRTMPLEQAIAYALETKNALPTDAKPREVNAEEASSDLPPGALSSPPSPLLSPPRALKQHFGGLTAREREVARLVAQGKSNRAIADELVIGVSTVEAHITHIFTKLGFSSRAQIAAWAVEKGLAQAPQDWRASDGKG